MEKFKAHKESQENSKLNQKSEEQPGESIKLGEKRGWQKAKEQWQKDQKGIEDLKKKVGEPVESEVVSEKPQQKRQKAENFSGEELRKMIQESVSDLLEQKLNSSIKKYQEEIANQFSESLKKTFEQLKADQLE